MATLFEVYSNVLKYEMDRNGLIGEDVANAARFILDFYSTKGLNLPDAINFNDPAKRCAYMYVYSTCHTYMVIEGLSQFLSTRHNEFFSWFNVLEQQKAVNLCSIGGGPGSDIIGLILFLQSCTNIFDLNNIDFNCTVADAYKGWEGNMRAILDTMFYHHPVGFANTTLDYTAEDLLQGFSDPLIDDLRNSDIVTMVKFVSAIAGDTERTTYLLKRIFNLLKPGCLILFIDNTGGPGPKNAINIANWCGMETVFGPELFEGYTLDKKLEPMWNVNYFINAFNGLKPKITGNSITTIWKKPFSIRRRGLKRTVSWTLGKTTRRHERHASVETWPAVHSSKKVIVTDHKRFSADHDIEKSPAFLLADPVHIVQSPACSKVSNEKQRIKSNTIRKRKNSCKENDYNIPNKRHAQSPLVSALRECHNRSYGLSLRTSYEKENPKEIVNNSPLLPSPPSPSICTPKFMQSPTVQRSPLVQLNNAFPQPSPCVPRTTFIQSPGAERIITLDDDSVPYSPYTTYVKSPLIERVPLLPVDREAFFSPVQSSRRQVRLRRRILYK